MLLDSRGVRGPLAIFQAPVASWRAAKYWTIASVVGLAGSPSGPLLPDGLTIALPEHEDHLSPTFAIPDPDAAGALVQRRDSVRSPFYSGD